MTEQAVQIIITIKLWDESIEVALSIVVGFDGKPLT